MSPCLYEQPFVYFIRPIGMEGPVKIGCSLVPEDRLSMLMAWSPFPLEIAATVPGHLKLERSIHACFAKSHTHREWFAPSPQLTSLIEGLQAGKPLKDLIDLKAVQGDIRREITAEWRSNHSARMKEIWVQRKAKRRKSTPLPQMAAE